LWYSRTENNFYCAGGGPDGPIIFGLAVGPVKTGGEKIPLEVGEIFPGGGVAGPRKVPMPGRRGLSGMRGCSIWVKYIRKNRAKRTKIVAMAKIDFILNRILTCRIN